MDERVHSYVRDLRDEPSYRGNCIICPGGPERTSAWLYRKTAAGFGHERVGEPGMTGMALLFCQYHLDELIAWLNLYFLGRAGPLTFSDYGSRWAQPDE